MDAARAVVELFEAKGPEEARHLANHLDTRNRERMEAQREIFNRAIEEFETGAERASQTHVAVIAGDGWHRGVIGLAASKIAERLNRPCVLSRWTVTSATARRAARAYHLFDGLTSCRDLLENSGAIHTRPAFNPARSDCGFRRPDRTCSSCLTEDDLAPALSIDAELEAKELGFRLAQDLRALEPFGREPGRFL
jgi:single-stranded-DNA-specific exonuclease